MNSHAFKKICKYYKCNSTLMVLIILTINIKTIIKNSILKCKRLNNGLNQIS